MEQHSDFDGSQLEFERWIEALRTLKGRYSVVAAEPKAFTGRLAPKNVCGFDAVDSSAKASMAERTARDVRLDGCDHYYAVFQMTGRSTVIQNDVATELGRGEVAIVDSARPVTYIIENGYGEWLSLVLPRQALLSHLGFEPKPSRFQSGRTRAGRLLFQLASDDTEDAVQSTRAGACMRLAVYDLLGALFAPSHEPGISLCADKIFERVCDVIRCRFTDSEVNPQEVADEAGISLRYLQKLFTVRNSTYTHFVTSLRLDYAADLLRRRSLTGTGQPLSTIAYACGYRDYSHFARAFRRRFGRAPGATPNDHALMSDASAVRSGAEKSAL